MGVLVRHIDATTRCAFCGKSLPILNGHVDPWRAPDGQFFCNEFCADDAEEMRFQRHGRLDRRPRDRMPLALRR